jgi:hypothetical protein
MPQNPTPDTTSFLLLGLAVVAVIMLLLVASMVVRYQNLKRDARTLLELEAEEDQPPAAL